MLPRRNPQLNKHGELVHLLSIEGLPRAVVHQILDTAGSLLRGNDQHLMASRAPTAAARGWVNEVLPKHKEISSEPRSFVFGARPSPRPSPGVPGEGEKTQITQTPSRFAAGSATR